MAGARVQLVYSLQELAETPQATSGEDGRFTIRIPRTVLDSVRPEYRAKFPLLMARKAGFAPGWIGGIFRDDAPAEQAIQLVDSGPAVEGKLVDLEGRPVSGARVQMKSLHYANDGTLSAWLDAAKLGSIQGIWRGLQSMTVDNPDAVITGTDGRFRLDGPGRERLAELLVTGPTVATDTLYVMGRDEPEIRTVDKSWVEPRPIVFHAPKFQHAAAPSKPIEGYVRDKDTGKPIAGLMIRANVSARGITPGSGASRRRPTRRGITAWTACPRRRPTSSSCSSATGPPTPTRSSRSRPSRRGWNPSPST